MANMVNNSDVGVINLDPRYKPEWELMDLADNRADFEHELFQSATAEFTDIAGFPVEIWLYEPSRTDDLYGESTRSTLDGPYATKVLIEAFKEPYMINVLGFMSDQTIEYAEMPKSLWLRDVSEQLDAKYELDFDQEERMPRPGDVIHFLWNDEKYEITSVDAAEKVFQGIKHNWAFVLKPYRIGNEGKTETELLTADNVDDDYIDDRNKTYSRITLSGQNKEKTKIAALLPEDSQSSDFDPAFYGYDKGITS